MVRKSNATVHSPAMTKTTFIVDEYYYINGAIDIPHKLTASIHQCFIDEKCPGICELQDRTF